MKNWCKEKWKTLFDAPFSEVAGFVLLHVFIVNIIPLTIFVSLAAVIITLWVTG